MSNSRAGYGPHSSAQPSHPPSRSQTHMRQMIPGRLNNMMANSSISTQVTHDPNFSIPTIPPNYYYMSPPILPQPQYTSSLPGATNQGYPRQLLYVNNLYPNNILLPYIRNPSMSVPANANLATHGLPNNNEVPSYNNEAGQMHSQMTQLAGQSISATNFYPQPSLASQLPHREKKPAVLQDPKTLEVLSLESKENSDPTASNNQAKASNKVEETTLVAQTSSSEQPGNIACEEFVNKISAAAMTSKDMNSNEAAAATAVTSDSSNVEGNESTKDIESNAKSEISKKSAHLPKSDIFTLQSTIKDSNVPVQTQSSSINSSDDFVSSKKNNLNQEMTSTENISSNKLKASASSTIDEAGGDEKKTEELKVSETRNREEKQNKDKDKKNEKVGELKEEKSDLNKLNSESTTLSQNDTSLQYSDAKNNRLKQTKSENIEEDKTSNESLTSNKAILKGDEVNISKNSNSADLPLTLKEKSQDVSATFVAITSESNEKLKNNSKIDVNLESSEDKGNRDNSEIDKDGTNKQSDNNVSLEKSKKQEKISSESVILEIKQDEENEHLSNEKSDDKEKTAPSKDLTLPGIIPNNKGKLEYDAKYLKNLRTHSLCLKKPQLPPLDIVLKVPNTQNKTSVSSEPNFLPQFVSSTYSRQMPPRLSGRGSQGRMPLRNMTKIIPSASLTQDVKLHTVENAYKPPVYNVKQNVNQVPSELEAIQTEDMLKRFRGILNKLTPQNYQKLQSQIDQLTINTVDRLTKVIELIFDKAIDEPAFCVQYAKLCSHVSRLQVKDVSEDKQKSVELQFRNVLVLRCQNEFEGGMYRGIDIKERLKKIEETQDPEQQKILETELEEDKRKSRIRQLGIMKFIGELYTCGLIAAVIMVQCLQTLCAKNDEESLECLCTLLRATGCKLDQCKNLNKIFSHLQTTVDEKRTTARIRFKIQDILDMKRDGWKVRKIQDENKPRTIDQIHKEAREEEQIKQLEIQQHMLKKQDSLIKKPALRQDEWISASRRSNSGPTQQQMLESFKKLQDKTTNAENVQLGPSYTSMGWARGAHCGTQMQKPQSSDLFSRNSAHNDKDNRNLRQSSNSINRDKGRVNQTLGPQLHQMRNYNPSQDTDYSYSGRTSGGRMPSSSLFGSSEMKNEVASRNNSMEKSSAQNSRNSSIKLESPSKEALKGAFTLKGKADLSEEDLQQKTLDMLKDFIRIPDFQKASCCVVELCNEQNVDAYVLTAINHALELSSQNDRILIGKLLCHLVMGSIISDEQFYKGLHKLLEDVDDIAVDVPRLWDYMGEIFTHFFLQLKDKFRRTFFIKCLSPCIAVNKAAKLMVNIVKCASTLKSQNEVGQIWKSSGLMWSEFLPKDVDEKKFISDNEMLFTVEVSKVSQKGHKGSVIDKEFSDKIDALSDFIMTLKDSPLETLISYINKNFSPDEFSKPQFVSALYKSIVKSCITIKKDSMSYSLNVELLKDYFNKFGTKFTQGDDKCELQTLFALQTLMEELEHPKNLLLEIFHPLYECAVISKEAFFEWEKSGEELRGKGVSVMEVKQFLLWLSEGDEDSDS